MSYKKTKELHRLTLKADWMEGGEQMDQLVHAELLGLMRIFLVIFAETWTHKPRELISREYVKGTTRAESQDTILLEKLQCNNYMKYNVTMNDAHIINNSHDTILMHDFEI